MELDRHLIEKMKQLGGEDLFQEFTKNVRLINRKMVGSSLLFKAQEIINKDGIELETAENTKPFLTTTQNQRYLDKTLPVGRDTSACIVLGAADSLFELLARDVKNITAVEISELQLLVSKLRIAAFKTLEHKDFVDFLVDNDSKRFLSMELLNEVCSALQDDEQTMNVWKYLIAINPQEDLKYHLVKRVEDMNGNLQSLKYGVSYLKKRSIYYKIRDQIEKTNIRIIAGDIISYLLEHEDEKFDYIDITNVLLFYYQIQCNNDKKIFKERMSKLRKIYDINLKMNGVFTFDYQFGIHVKHYDELLQKSFVKENVFSTPILDIYKTTFECLQKYYTLEVDTVERIIEGMYYPYDSYIYTRKK